MTISTSESERIMRSGKRTFEQFLNAFIMGIDLANAWLI